MAEYVYLNGCLPAKILETNWIPIKRKGPVRDQIRVNKIEADIPMGWLNMFTYGCLLSENAGHELDPNIKMKGPVRDEIRVNKINRGKLSLVETKYPNCLVYRMPAWLDAKFYF